MILSILIPTLPARSRLLQALVAELQAQADQCQTGEQVEILVNGAEQLTTGEKRNQLLQRARGEYVTHFDDDDWPMSMYIREILQGACSDADCMAINGLMTTDGKNPMKWFISKTHPYCSAPKNGEIVYLRYTNHLAPVKRRHALAIGFPHITFGEDYDYATRLKNSGLLQTEHTIRPAIYHYRYTSIK